MRDTSSCKRFAKPQMACEAPISLRSEVYALKLLKVLLLTAKRDAVLAGRNWDVEQEL